MVWYSRVSWRRGVSVNDWHVEEKRGAHPFVGCSGCHCLSEEPKQLNIAGELDWWFY